MLSSYPEAQLREELTTYVRLYKPAVVMSWFMYPTFSLMPSNGWDDLGTQHLLLVCLAKTTILLSRQQQDSTPITRPQALLHSTQQLVPQPRAASSFLLPDQRGMWLSSTSGSSTHRACMSTSHPPSISRYRSSCVFEQALCKHLVEFAACRFRRGRSTRANTPQPHHRASWKSRRCCAMSGPWLVSMRVWEDWWRAFSRSSNHQTPCDPCALALCAL